MPSHSENFGIVVTEALGCGSLVSISNKVNIFEEIENAKAGLIFNDTKNDTVRVINQWLELDKEEKINIRKNARILFDKKFNLTNNASKFANKLNNYFENKN